MNILNKQKGTAIIVAMFVTALVAAASVAMIEYLQIDTRRTQLLMNDIQANQSAQGSLDWALDQLTNNMKLKQPNKAVDILPMRSPINMVNGAKIYSIIYDAQSRLNLNNLLDKKSQAIFIRLINTVDPELGESKAQNIMQSIIDWITPGIIGSTYDTYYAKLNPPYRAPHINMASVSELRLVKGMTPALYAKLSRYVTALPEKTPVNINTADVPLLMSLAQGITLQTAKAIVGYRTTTPVTSTANLANFDVVKNNPIDQNTITSTSNYFLVITHVIIGEQDVQLNTLLKRTTIHSQPNMLVVWQSKGTV